MPRTDREKERLVLSAMALTPEMVSRSSLGEVSDLDDTKKNRDGTTAYRDITRPVAVNTTSDYLLFCIARGHLGDGEVLKARKDAADRFCLDWYLCTRQRQCVMKYGTTVAGAPIDTEQVRSDARKRFNLAYSEIPSTIQTQTFRMVIERTKPAEGAAKFIAKERGLAIAGLDMIAMHYGYMKKSQIDFTALQQTD